MEKLKWPSIKRVARELAAFKRQMIEKGQEVYHVALVVNVTRYDVLVSQAPFVTGGAAVSRGTMDRKTATETLARDLIAEAKEQYVLDAGGDDDAIEEGERSEDRRGEHQETVRRGVHAEASGGDRDVQGGKEEDEEEDHPLIREAQQIVEEYR